MSRVVVVIGASADLARTLARDLARSGDRVAVLTAPGTAAAGEEGRWSARRPAPLRVLADVADPDAVEVALAEVEELLGPVDVWVNTTPPVPGRSAHDLHPGHLRSVTDEVYLAVVHATLAAVERMRAHGGGTVVQVTSVLVGRAAGGRAAEAGALAAVRGFTEALAAELRAEHSPVRVHHLQAGPDDEVGDVAREVVRIAHRPVHRGRRLLRAGAVGTGAAVATGTAVLLRRRHR